MTGTTVQTGSDGAPDSGVYGWDWSATTHEARNVSVHELVGALGADRVIPGKGYQGWSQSVECFDGDGFKVGQVYYGAARDDVHVVSSSSAAELSRWAVLGVDGDARTARVDTRVDTLVPWADLVEVVEDAAAVYGSQVITMEKRVRGESQGRTVYLGAPTSAVRVRLYEKWLESPGQYVEGTNRVEVQLRPPSRVKAAVSDWEPSQTFCASKTTRLLAERLGTELAPKASLHVARGVPDLERTLQVMGEQYGPSVDKWLALSGGDVDTVVDRLLGNVEGSRLEVAPF